MIASKSQPIKEMMHGIGQSNETSGKISEKIASGQKASSEKSSYGKAPNPAKRQR
jgi:hypothetical protein